MTLRDRLRGWFAADTLVRKVALATVVCVGAAAMLTDWRGGAVDSVAVGTVAADDVVAPFTFAFIDVVATAERQHAAEAAVAPVYDVDSTVTRRLQSRVSQAFDMARRRLAAAPAEDGKPPDPALIAAVVEDFAAALELTLDPDVAQVLVREEFSPAAESVTNELIDVGTRKHIVRDRSDLPPAPPVAVITLVGSEREESVLADFSQLRTPDEARQAISLHVVERYAGGSNPAVIQAAAGLARAMLEPNFSFNQLLTSERQKAARDAVEPVEVQVRRGARVIGAGDVVDERQAQMVDALRHGEGSVGVGWRFSVWLAFVSVVVLAPVGFARQTIRKFASGPGELEALALVLLFVLGLGRIAASSARFVEFPVRDDVGALGLLVPVAGGAMLVRILVNSESALIFSLVAALLSGAMMDQSALLAAWYLVTAITAAGMVGQARERLNVLRSGAMAGLVGAGLSLVITLVRAQASAGSVGGLDWKEAAFQVITAFAAGIVSAMMALGLVPAMEMLGFLTDYKLFELSNLNHPLLKRLMLHAPGTHHHSAMVGSLAEAACESIGANALLARVACYFHDIGKGIKPQYFVENQRDGQNRHDRLTPEQSAQIVINHVREGAMLARQYDLPPPIYDNIFMHHGTGLIPYFYNRAKEQSGGKPVDEALFRYPGPKPNTREAGVIMLADKVEAACRTIKEPSEERMRAMIQVIVNQVMSDGQLEECPLTLKELYRIAGSFVAVLTGIHHHRIEYPATRAISQGAGKYVPVPQQGTITLEIVNPLKAEPASNAPMPDYESVEAEPPPPQRTEVDH